MSFNSVDEILDFAISNEEEAVVFYNELAGKMKNPEMVKIFTDFAKEEGLHKEKLLDIKKGKLFLSSGKKILDLKISDYIDTDVKITEDMSYEEALLIAMKKEQSSFKLYSALAEKTSDEGLRNTLLVIAQEEAKHKLRFEIEYDEMVLREN